jgi:hypothetical protein
MPVTEKFDRPLIVIVHKFDAWRPLLRSSPNALDDVIRAGQNGVSCLHLDVLMEVSRDIEKLLLEHGPSIVTAARGFASEVVFIPVTATGRSPIVAGSDANGRVDLLFDPSQISPRWVELPEFYCVNGGDQSWRSACEKCRALSAYSSRKMNIRSGYSL